MKNIILSFLFLTIFSSPSIAAMSVEIDKNSYEGCVSEIYAAYFHGLEWVQHGYYKRTNRYKISNRQEIDKNSYKGRVSEIYAAYFHGLEWVQHGYYKRVK
jgi:phage-related protein